MAVIQPCHYCATPVTSDEHFPHNVVCASSECQERKRQADESMRVALERMRQRS